MLTIIGLVLMCIGAWFLGAIFMVAPNSPFIPKDQPYRNRAIGGYMIGIAFVGIGIVLVTGI